MMTVPSIRSRNPWTAPPSGESGKTWSPVAHPSKQQLLLDAKQSLSREMSASGNLRYYFITPISESREVVSLVVSRCQFFGYFADHLSGLYVFGFRVTASDDVHALRTADDDVLGTIEGHNLVLILAFDNECFPLDRQVFGWSWLLKGFADFLKRK